jgi:hypothetical protein
MVTGVLRLVLWGCPVGFRIGLLWFWCTDSSFGSKPALVLAAKTPCNDMSGQSVCHIDQQRPVGLSCSPQQNIRGAFVDTIRKCPITIAEREARGHVVDFRSTV